MIYPITHAHPTYDEKEPQSMKLEDSPTLKPLRHLAAAAIEHRIMVEIRTRN